MRTTLKGLLVVTMLLALTLGCSSDSGAEEEGVTTSTSQCVDKLTVKGVSWVAWPLSNPLERELVGQPRTGTQTTCDDVEGDPPESPEETEVVLRRIDGLRGSSALFRPDNGYTDIIYVPGDQSTTFQELPKKVRRLIKHG